MKNEIVITGIGVVASNGIGKEAFWNALQKGVSGIKPVSLFDTGSMKSKQAGEIKDFDAKLYLGDKGLRLLDRSTKLVNVAAKLALDDGHFTVTEDNADETGVVLGTTLGSVWSISEFDKTALKEGPRYVNPALFPNTVINSPASQISIRFKIKGFNTTISTGFTSALDALKYACDFIKMGRADAVLVGGAEELCLQTYLGFYKLRFLSGSKQGAPEINCPFDARRNGIVFGEGAAMVLIEDEKAARSRGAHIYGEITSMGYSFFPFRLNKYHKLGTGLKEAMGKALREADLKPVDIDYISANANSRRRRIVSRPRRSRRFSGRTPTVRLSVPSSPWWGRPLALPVPCSWPRGWRAWKKILFLQRSITKEKKHVAIWIMSSKASGKSGSVMRF